MLSLAATNFHLPIFAVSPSTIPAEIGQLINLTILSFSRNKLTTLPAEIGQLTKLTKLNLSKNSGLEDLPIALGDIPGLTFFSTAHTQIQEERANQILAACQALRYKAALGSLPDKILLWKSFAGIKDAWPALKGSEQEMKNLHEWLVRLSRTSDFGSVQAELAQVVCTILFTLHEDPGYFQRFSNLVAGDLRDCEDRAAMSLNLVYADWMLYIAERQGGSPEELAKIIVSYGRTLVFRLYMTKHYEYRSDPVEVMLNAEIRLKYIGLLSAIKTMKHERHWGHLEDHELDHIREDIEKISKAECICQLESWMTCLEKHRAEELRIIRDGTALAS